MLNNTNSDSKEVLARLLAEENLRVVFRKVGTANFQLKERVLTLPVLQTSNLITNWHVGHEVSHALHTPADAYHTLACKYGDLVNIVEDIRVNKKICERYPGLKWVSRAAYEEMWATGFYGTIDEYNIDIKPFPDRINIHCKVGAVAGASFTSEEQDIIDYIQSIELFHEVENACKMVKDYIDAHKQDVERQTLNQNDVGGMDDEEIVVDTQIGDDDTQIGDDVAPDAGTSANNDEPIEAESVKNEATAFIDVAEENDATIAYRTIPTMYNWNDWVMNRSEFCRFLQGILVDIEPEDEFENFMKTNRKIIEDAAQTFLVNREVNCSSPELVYHSGVLDPNKLHAHAYDENVFLREIVVKDNSTKHGLCMFVDYSYSMLSRIHSTIQQLLNLIMFAREANIPFKVYGFTRIYGTQGGEYEFDNENINFGYIGNKNKIMFEMFDSNMSQQEFINMANVVLCYSFAVKHKRNIYNFMNNTPLNMVLHMAKHIGEEFKNENNLEKLQMVFLTDGASNAIANMNEGVKYHTTDMVLNKTTEVTIDTITQTLVNNLSEYLDAEVTNFYIMNNKRFKQYSIWYNDTVIIERALLRVTNTSERLNDFPLTYIINDARFDIDGVKTNYENKRTAVASFAKKGRVAKTSRILMNEFAEMIA